MNTTAATSNTNARNMFRRLTAGATLAAAPMLIALGAAAASHADTGASGPDVTINAPVGHRGPERNQDIMRGYLPHTSLSHHHRRAYDY